MDFFDAVKNRHSYRGKFQKAVVSDADIKQIMEAALAAPSGLNLQTTSFVVVKNADLRAKIAEILPTSATETAPVIIVAMTEKITAHGMCFEVEDYAAAVENILLAASALGYGAVWMDGMTRANQINEEIGKLLGLPKEKTVRTIIPLGIPAEEITVKEKKPYEERVTVI
jgi:nitroreductase